MTSEQFREIKYRFENYEGNFAYTSRLLTQDLPALISEVERLNSRLEASRDVSHFLKEQLVQAEESDRILTKRLEVLTKALEFYSNEEKYVREIEWHNSEEYSEYESEVDEDKGETARKALGG